MVFRSLFRCLRRSFDRLKQKFSKKQRQARSTQYGADIDIEEALAEQLEIQRRSGRTMSSTASIAAALRQRPREMPVFATQLGSESHRESPHEDAAVQNAVQEMQSLTPGFTASGGAAEAPETVVSARTVSPVKKVTVKVPPPVPETPEQENEQKAGAETAEVSEKTDKSVEMLEKAVSLPDTTEPEVDPAAKVPVTSKSLDSEPPTADLPPRRSSVFNMRSEWI